MISSHLVLETIQKKGSLSLGSPKIKRRTSFQEKISPKKTQRQHLQKQESLWTLSEQIRREAMDSCRKKKHNRRPHFFFQKNRENRKK